MSGILFLRTGQLGETIEFYTGQIDCTVWLDQGDCVILRHENLLVGFCERESPQTDVMLTFFYDTPQAVDRLFGRLRGIAVAPPRYNDRYRVYQFFARDPEGRILEFQHFAHPIAQFRSGGNLLTTRRSIREFTADPVPDALIHRIIDSCRFAPTAYNNQPQYYRIVRDPDDLRFLAGVRESASEPIGRAPVAVAVCIDTARTAHAVVDGAAAVYHFLLAAWDLGLATCWMGDMDQPLIRTRLGIPPADYVATVTPLGYPREYPDFPPTRQNMNHFIR